MGYIIGQYNHNEATSDDNQFMTLVTTGEAKVRPVALDYNTGSDSDSSTDFVDQCVVSELSPIGSDGSVRYYYCKCQIQRTVEMEQTFNIKLVNYETTGAEDVEQFIKTVVVQSGPINEWVNIEFIFHPIISFDTILFQLARKTSDYINWRMPKIIYQQLGIIQNIIPSKVGAGIKLLKIGVQSRPGMALCINGEEIHLSRTGMFEVKNGIISIDFFSAVTITKETTDTIDNVKKQIEEGTLDTSYCGFNTPKEKTVEAFTLDYMYEE